MEGRLMSAREAAESDHISRHFVLDSRAYCYICGWNVDVFDLVKFVRGCGTREACLWLIDLVQLQAEVPPPKTPVPKGTATVKAQLAAIFRLGVASVPWLTLDDISTMSDQELDKHLELIRAERNARVESIEWAILTVLVLAIILLVVTQVLTLLAAFVVLLAVFSLMGTMAEAFGRFG
jgi:hypothetical protein